MPTGSDMEERAGTRLREALCPPAIGRAHCWALNLVGPTTITTLVFLGKRAQLLV